MPNWPALGLRVGLEIHQQLDTDKLFCRCPSLLVDEHDLEFTRRLRPTQSELGEVDRAALEQARRSFTFRYLASHKSSCLVEMDEEPPHGISPRAVWVGAQVARLLGMTLVDEIQVMRKIVIDGSNTTGFQRTSLLATGGSIRTEAGPVSLQTMCLEEDACRKVEESGGVVTYRLDRLGIPLLEVATGPDIQSPEQAREAALAIGQALRATGRVKRGIGTIRQDLNISIAGGARVELKGVQELRLIPIAVEREAKRQQRSIEVAVELRERGAKTEDLDDLPMEVQHLFQSTGSKVIEKAIAAGGIVLALRLPRFAGLVGSESKDAPRLGAELAGYARVRAGVKGLFHSDELPAYGVSEAEVAGVREALGCGVEDAFVLVSEKREVAVAAIEAARERAKMAISGVPEETREVQDDGSSRYLRPLPGSARMYPETDVPPFEITAALRAEIEANLPEMPEAKEKRMAQAYALHREELRQIIRGGYADAFEEIVRSEGEGSEKAVARVFLHTIPELAKEGVSEEAVTPEMVKDAFSAMREGAFAKEAVPRVLKEMATTGRDARSVASALGLGAVDEAAVRTEIGTILDRNAKVIEEKGERALSALMGDAMKALRGKADGALINKVLREELAKRLAR